MKILITGSAGFIGYYVTKEILKNDKNLKVIGIDSLNHYYDVNLKKKRLYILKKFKNFAFIKDDLLNKKKIHGLFKKNKFDYLIHLAAQAGVRYSFENPRTYFDNNFVAFFNLLESCRVFKIKHLMFASTSSVYGDSKKFPVKESFSTDFPLSFYAATKKSNEIIAYSYSKMFKMRITGLRFFTVYGPFGRPDMALFNFTKKILQNKPINVFNKGDHERDFTFIDDVTKIVLGLIKVKNKNLYNVFNVGNGKSRKLKDYILEIEKNLKLKSKKINLSLQKGDVHKTHADIGKIKKFKFFPKKRTSIESGVKKFIFWFKEFYNYK